MTLKSSLLRHTAIVAVAAAVAVAGTAQVTSTPAEARSGVGQALAIGGAVIIGGAILNEMSKNKGSQKKNKSAGSDGGSSKKKSASATKSSKPSTAKSSTGGKSEPSAPRQVAETPVEPKTTGSVAPVVVAGATMAAPAIIDGFQVSTVRDNLTAQPINVKQIAANHAAESQAVGVGPVVTAGIGGGGSQSIHERIAMYNRTN